MERLCPARPPWEFHPPLEKGRSGSRCPACTSYPTQQHQFGPRGFSGNPGNCKSLPMGIAPCPVMGSLAFLTQSKALGGMGKPPGFHIRCGWVIFIPSLPKNLGSG